MSNPFLFTSYWFYGDIEFILKDSEDVINYFLNNFLLIYSYGTDDNFNLYFEPSYRHKIIHIEIIKHCPLIECIEIERGQTKLTKQQIKQWIDNGWNIIAKIDKSQISDCPNAGINWHEAMIYKYKGEYVFFSDNGKTGKFFTDFSCYIDEYINAFNNIEKSPYKQDEVWKKYFWLCRPRENSKCEMDVTKILNSLRVYLNLIPYQNLYDKDLRSIYFDLNIFIGQKVYGNLIQFVKYFERNQNRENPASSHLGGISVLCDHKRLLVQMANELEIRYGISNYYKKRFEEILVEMQIIRSMVLKYYINLNNKQLLNRICKRIQCVKHKERNVLLKLINEIEKL